MTHRLQISSTNEDGIVTADLLKLVDSRLLVTANSGGGKSYLLRLIAEQAAGEAQIVILDPEGEFATLREKFDFLLVGRSGEIPAEPRAAGLLARRLLELQASAVIDLYDLRLPDRRRFVRLFLESLMNLPKTLWRPLLVMLDEAHLFCPERSAGDAESTAAVIDLMSQGRKRSYCGILATQRLSKLHKDAEAETNNVVVGRTWLDLDQKRAGALLGMERKDQLQLRDLDAGEFFAFGPALSANGVTRFRTNAVQTTHPKAGQRHKLTPPKPSDAVQRIVADLADLPQQAEAEITDLAAAKKRIGELERQLKGRPAETKTVEVEKRVEVPVLKNGQLKRTETILERMHAQGERLLAESAELRRLITPAAQPVPAAVYPKRIPSPQPAARQASAATPSAEPTSPSRPVLKKNLLQQLSAIADGVTVPQQRILDALAWLESVRVPQAKKVQLALLAEQSPTSSGYGNNLGALRSAGLIEYPSPGRVVLTEAGRAAAHVPDAPPTSEDLHRRLAERLPAPQWRILNELIGGYPDDVDKAELAERAGQSPTSSGYGNNLGALRSLGLIDYPRPGRVKALPVLFLEG